MKSNLLERRTTTEKPSFVKRTSTWLAVGAALLLSACGNREEKVPEESPRYLLQSELSNAFPVDEAHMSPEEKKEFERLMTEFLQAHNNPKGIQELERSRITLEVSSDERDTKKWPGGNEELSEARAKEIKAAYYRLVNTLRTQKSFNQFSGFFAKKINTLIAVSPEHGRGVTSLSQLTNPATGKHYTPDELSKLSKDELEKLYDQCRYIKILIENPQPGDRIRQYKELVKKLSDFPITRILLDRSGSMNEENHIFADQISAALTRDITGFSSHDNKAVTFSEKVDWEGYSALRTKEEVANFMEKTWAHGGDEHQFKAVMEMMDKLDTEYGSSKGRQPSAIVMLSDEGANDFSLEGLMKIIERSQKTNTTVFFAFINDKSPEKIITMVDAPGLLTEFQEFVTSFEEDEYFPKERMTPEEKKAYILESMEAYGQADAEYRGVAVDKNGNIRFQYPQKAFQENINTRWVKLEKRFINSLIQLDTKYKIEFHEIDELYKAGKITYEEYEKRGTELQQKREKEARELDKNAEKEKEKLRTLYRAIEKK